MLGVRVWVHAAVGKSGKGSVCSRAAPDQAIQSRYGRMRREVVLGMLLGRMGTGLITLWNQHGLLPTRSFVPRVLAA